MIALLCLATALPVAAGDIAIAPNSNRTSGWTQITDIKVTHAPGGAVEIRITADGPLRARSRRLSNPERFVLDLQDALFTGDTRTIDVESGDIKSVRVAPLHQQAGYQQEGRVTRVVVDLAALRQIDVTPAGNTLILKLADASTPQGRTLVGAPAAAAERSNALRSSGGESDPAAEQRDSSARHASADFPSVPEGRPASQPAPNAISAQIADNDSPSLTAAVALEKTADASDAQIFGVGVTGHSEDPTLGVDVQRVLGPGKEDKKNKKPNPESDAPPKRVFHLSGEAIGGYYQADSQTGRLFHEASPIGSLHLDASGYLFHPGFFNFNVRPQGSLGRESSEGIFPDGRGVAATTTFLGGSSTPLTLSYSRLNRNLVTFGPLDRLAGLEANTFQDSLGVNWTLRLKRLPEIALSFSKFSDSYEPLADMAPKTANAARLGSIEMRQKAMGWNLQSRYKLERASQDLINIFDPAQAPYLYKRNDQEARASADRGFGEWLSVAFVAGATKSQNQLQGRPFDQSYRFATGNSIFRPNKKLTLAFHGGVTNNVVGASLEPNAGNTLTADRPFLLVPTTARLQLVSYSVSAGYALRKDLNFHADVSREATHPQETSAIITPESSLTSAQAGVSWSQRLRFVRFQSNYAANLGSFVYGSAGSSRSSGHKADLGATVGSLHTLELTAGVQGSMQDVTGNTYMRDRSWGTSATLSRTFGEQWKLQATYNRARDRYNFLDQLFSSDGNGFSFTLFHPRLDLTASHNIRDGLTFQADPRLQYVSSQQAGMLLGAYPGTLMVPAGADWSSASVSVHPVGKFRARGTWLRSRQQLQGAVSNRYTEWEATAGYQFRSLSFDVGYIVHDQNFGVDIFQRNRLFFRVVREFTVF